MGQIKFIDESGDKKYFTIIPNLIINGYNAIESGVYLYIKRRAGEGGEFFETQQNAAENLGIHRDTFRRVMNKLEEDGKIKRVGVRKIKTRPVRIYQIIDVWRENIVNYEKSNVENKAISSGSNVENKAISNVENKATKKNPVKNNQLEEEASKTRNKVNEIICLFEKINPTINYGNKTTRKATDELIEKFGYNKVVSMAGFAISVQGEKYAPIITTPYELKEKLAKLKIYYDKENNQSNKYQVGKV